MEIFGFCKYICESMPPEHERMIGGMHHWRQESVVWLLVSIHQIGEKQMLEEYLEVRWPYFWQHCELLQDEPSLHVMTDPIQATQQLPLQDL